MTPTSLELPRAVSRAALERFGEPSRTFTYDARAARVVPPHDHLEVMVWHPTDELEMTTLMTIGMSALALPTARHRVELVFSVGRAVSEQEERACSSFLANMAGYPWDHQCALDFWHRLRNPGPIPCFPRCQAIIFHPRFVADGWDTVEHEGDAVRLLHAIPLTNDEATLAGDSVPALLDYLRREHINIFLDR